MKDKTLFANPLGLKLDLRFSSNLARINEISEKITVEMTGIFNINAYLENNSYALGSGEAAEVAEETNLRHSNIFVLEAEYKALKFKNSSFNIELKPFVLQTKLDAAKQRMIALKTHKAPIVSTNAESELFDGLGGVVNAIEKQLNDLDEENKSLFQSIANYNHYLSFDYNLSSSERSETNCEIFDCETKIGQNRDKIAELHKELAAANKAYAADAINAEKQR